MTSEIVENRDSFGLDATAYRDHRPAYPADLFDYLGRVTADHRTALDCATGNGQAACGLARDFRSVAAFDTSAAQLAAAIRNERVAYVAARAEALPFRDRTFSLIVAAQAAHWFDLDRFYGEVRRVCRKGAVVAIWGYSYCRVSPEVDRIVQRELLERIAPFWAAGNKVIMDRYVKIDFPFEEIEWPGFCGVQRWRRSDYMRYLGTWSATRKFVERHGRDPVAALDEALAPVWEDGLVMPVCFDFVGRCGRV